MTASRSDTNRPLLGLLAALLCLGMVAATTPAAAEDGEPGRELARIAAVVNDDIITFHDLEMRLRIMLMSSGLEDTPEVRRSLGPRLLRELIDERLQLQEARRLDIEVPESDIDRGVAQIEKNNRLPAGRLEQVLASQGVDIAALRQQVRAEIAWSRAVQARLMSRVIVTAEEVQERLAMLKNSQGRPQYLLAEILLPVEDAAAEAEARQLAQHMIARLRDGLSFPALAEQFSASPTAAAGGDMGWVAEAALDDHLVEAVQKMRPGEMTLVREEGALRLLVLRDRRVVGEDGLPGAGELRRQLEQERLELVARKHLRNLRRSAAVDIRR